MLLDAYGRHLTAVAGRFADRPGDLLVMDITAGQGWEALCPFLGLEAPAGVAFPVANAGDGAGGGSAYPARAEQAVTRGNFGRIFGKYAG
jgi:hypothetical protein